MTILQSSNLLNDSLEQQPTFVYDEEGKITGYTTKTGGADTVFPFKNCISLRIEGCRTAIYNNGSTWVADTSVTIYNNETNSVINTKTITEGRDSYDGVALTTEINGKDYTFKAARVYPYQKYFFTITIEDENNNVLAANKLTYGSRDDEMSSIMYFNMI